MAERGYSLLFLRLVGVLAMPYSHLCDLLCWFQALEGQHGAMLAVGFLIGGIYSQSRAAALQDMETDAAMTSQQDEIFRQAAVVIGSLASILAPNKTNEKQV